MNPSQPSPNQPSQPSQPNQPLINPNQPMSPHRAAAMKKLSPTAAKLFKYIEFDDDEELLAEIRKHPIGAVYIAIIGILIAVVIGGAAILFSFNADSLSAGFGDVGTLKTLVLIFGILLALVSLAATAIMVVLYINSVIYLTTEKIAEVSYLSLFNRKVTQLGAGNIEDVTVQQKGIFARVFDYGTIIVETAGEVENCTFTMMPHPNFYSQQIIQLHEAYIEKHGNKI